MSVLWRLLSIVRSAGGWKSSVAGARQTVSHLKQTAENFQVTLFQRTRDRASAGEPQAQFELAEYYYYGRGVPKDYAEAWAWFHRAASQGHPKAQLNTGLMCVLGRGVARDPVEGYSWLLNAAELQEPSAEAACQKAAAKLSPSDQAIAKERARLRGNWKR